MNRLNRHNTFRNRLLERISGVMFNDNGAAPSGGGSAPTGGDPGGGGGVSGSPGPSGGGQQQQDAGHSFGNTSPPSPDHGTRVANLLTQSNSNPDMAISFDDIADLIKFDAPFKPTTPAPAAPAASATPAVPNAATAPPAPPAAPAAPPTQGITPEVLAEALRQAGIGGQPAAPTPANPTEPPPYYGGEVPALQIRPEIVSALVGTSDPAIIAQAAPAINTLVNGIMNRVIADQTARMQSTIATLMNNHVPQAIQQHTQVNNLETQFYADNKHLDKPNLKPLVNQISGLYAAAQKKTDPNFAWNKQHFSTVAQLVSRQFERIYGVPLAGAGPITTNAPGTPPANQQTVPPAPPAQPYMSSGSTRPPVVQPNSSQSADLLAFVN